MVLPQVVYVTFVMLPAVHGCAYEHDNDGKACAVYDMDMYGVFISARSIQQFAKNSCAYSGTDNSFPVLLVC